MPVVQRTVATVGLRPQSENITYFSLHSTVIDEIVCQTRWFVYQSSAEISKCRLHFFVANPTDGVVSKEGSKMGLCNHSPALQIW